MSAPTPHVYMPSQWDTAASLLQDALQRRYRGRTILDDQGQPFCVQCISIWNDSPDPGWRITFASKGPADTNPSLPALQTRNAYPDTVLPEMWPVTSSTP